MAKKDKSKQRKRHQKAEKKQQRRQQRQQRKEKQRVSPQNEEGTLSSRFSKKNVSSYGTLKINIPDRTFQSLADIRERQSKIMNVRVNSMTSEQKARFWGRTRQSWQGSATPNQRYDNIIDAYGNIIDSEYGGDVGKWMESVVLEDKDQIRNAYKNTKRSREKLKGYGWTDDELEALANAHSNEEIYELLKGMGFYQ